MTYNPFDIPALTYINLNKAQLVLYIRRVSDNEAFLPTKRMTKLELEHIALSHALMNRSKESTK